MNRFPSTTTQTNNNLQYNIHHTQHRTTIPASHEILEKQMMKSSPASFTSYRPTIPSTNNFANKSNFKSFMNKSGRPFPSSSNRTHDIMTISQQNKFHWNQQDQQLKNDNYLFHRSQYDEEQPRPKNFYPTPHPYPYSSNLHGHPPLSMKENYSTNDFANQECYNQIHKPFMTPDKDVSNTKTHKFNELTMNNDTILPFIQITYSSLLSYLPINNETYDKGTDNTNLYSHSQKNGVKRMEIPLTLKSFMKDEEHHIPNEIQSLLQFICPSHTDIYYFSIFSNTNHSINDKIRNNVPSNYWMANLQHPQTQFNSNDQSKKDLKSNIAWLSYLPRITLSLHPENPIQQYGADLSSYPPNYENTTTTSTDLSFTDQAMTIFRAEALVPMSTFQLSNISLDEMKIREPFVCGNDWGRNSKSGILWCCSTKRQIGLWISDSFCFFNKSIDKTCQNITKIYHLLSKNPFVFACCIFYNTNCHRSNDYFYLVITKTSINTKEQVEEHIPYLGFKVTSSDIPSLEHKQKDLFWKLYDYEADFVIPNSYSATKSKKTMTSQLCIDKDGLINGQFREVMKENKPVCFNSSYLSFPRNKDNASASNYPPSNISIKEKEHENLHVTIAKQKRQIKLLETQIKELVRLMKSQQGISEDTKLKLSSFENQTIVTNNSFTSKKAKNDRSIIIENSSHSSTKEDVISKLSNSPASFFDQSHGDADENVLSSASVKQGKWMEQSINMKQNCSNDWNGEKYVEKTESKINGIGEDKPQNDSEISFKCDNIDVITNGLDELSTMQRIEKKYLNQTSLVSKSNPNTHTISLDENFQDDLDDSFAGELSLYSRQLLHSTNDNLSNYEGDI